MIVIKFFLMCLMVIIASPSFADDVYLSTTGTKSSGKSVAGDWNDANCHGNLQSAMSAMSSGDTLTIADGIYTGSLNVINQFAFPPSGPGTGTGDERFTIIRAKNIPTAERLKVIFDGGSYAGIFATGSGYGAPDYLKFQGIEFWAAATYTGWDHLYFTQCAFMGTLDGNNAAAGLSGAYNLLEDCVFYGKGRYKVLFYDVTRTGAIGNNICRRCVTRNDFALKDTDAKEPIASFSSYFNRGTAFLNCLDVDSDSPLFWKTDPTEIAGAFYQPVDTGPHNMLVQGSIIVNSALGVAFTEGTGNKFVDVAAIHVGGGLYGKLGGMVNRLTLIDSGIDNFTYKSTAQINAFVPGYFGVNGYEDTVTLTNAIIRDVSPGGATVLGHTVSSYLDYYALGKPIGVTPTNSTTTDPYSGGLLYPVRIENESFLATAGSDGNAIGASIVYKLGKDGTFKGDADWNTEQGNLWPWPKEEWVKAQMSSMPGTIGGNAMPSANRGFCATGQSLTRYVWEYLGNAMPSPLYPIIVTDPTSFRIPGGVPYGIVQ